ncbi:hypothetical protein B0H14DRAFT_2602048 [Mycena olivaceomarginata]|nr:hypothetical protein B0H14DRAFT_2602048 [Mycena olivaceomarginata]
MSSHSQSYRPVYFQTYAIQDAARTRMFPLNPAGWCLIAEFGVTWRREVCTRRTLPLSPHLRTPPPPQNQQHSDYSRLRLGSSAPHIADAHSFQDGTKYSKCYKFWQDFARLTTNSAVLSRPHKTLLFRKDVEALNKALDASQSYLTEPATISQAIYFKVRQRCEVYADRLLWIGTGVVDGAVIFVIGVLFGSIGIGGP